jgi:hypothetical protein
MRKMIKLLEEFSDEEYQSFEFNIGKLVALMFVVNDTIEGDTEITPEEATTFIEETVKEKLEFLKQKLN